MLMNNTKPWEKPLQLVPVFGICKSLQCGWALQTPIVIQTKFPEIIAQSRSDWSIKQRNRCEYNALSKCIANGVDVWVGPNGLSKCLISQLFMTNALDSWPPAMNERLRRHSKILLQNAKVLLQKMTDYCLKRWHILWESIKNHSLTMGFWNNIIYASSLLYNMLYA